MFHFGKVIRTAKIEKIAELLNASGVLIVSGCLLYLANRKQTKHIYIVEMKDVD